MCTLCMQSPRSPEEGARPSGTEGTEKMKDALWVPEIEFQVS